MDAETLFTNFVSWSLLYKLLFYFKKEDNAYII